MTDSSEYKKAFEAAENGNVNILNQAITDDEYCLEARDSAGRTVLMIAAGAGQIACIDIQAANDKAAPEELHNKLRDLLEEAIKVNIPLEKLLDVFSDSTLVKSGKSEFIDNVAKQYSYGEDAAEVKHDLASKREEELV